MPEPTEEQTAIYKMISEKGNEFRSLWSRMDDDKALLFLDAYKMMRPDLPDKEMANVINVTLNDPATFAARAIATLSSTQRQTEVSGREMEDKACTKIESFVDDFSFAINESLFYRDILELDAFLNEQACVRGRLVGRSLVRKDEKTGKLIVDVVPHDSRFFVYDMGLKGMNWGAAISWRGKKAIKDEYGYESPNDRLEVVDFYNDGRNIIFLDECKATKEQKNPFGEPPFVVATVPVGSMLSDEDAQQHRGESIFWQNRAIFPELNRLITIFQTLNVGSFAGAVQYESSLGTRAKRPAKPPWGIWSVTPIEKGGGYKPMPVNDIRNAARLAYAILYTRVQQGGLSAIDYGNLTFPLSAVAITRLTSGRDQIFLPRIHCKAVFYRELYRMIIKQFKAAGVKADLGEEGFINSYEPKDLEGAYKINFRFFTESKEQEIANYSIANAARGFLSEGTIRRNVIKVQDPEAEEERIDSEQAEKADEAIFLYRRCSSLIAQKRNIEAWMVYGKLRDLLRMRRMQSIIGAARALGTTEGKTPELPKGRQQLPLLGQGAAGGTIAPELGQEQGELERQEVLEEREAEQTSRAKQEIAEAKGR